MATIDTASLGLGQGTKVYNSSVSGYLFDDLGLVSNIGDINGDGLNDAIVKKALPPMPGQLSKTTNYVVLGQSSLATTFDIAGPETAGITIHTETNWLSGSIASAGDVNGDGYGDLIIGDIWSSSSAKFVSYVLFGGPSLPKIIHEPGLAALGVKIFGYEVGAGAGDINGDGFDDLILGSSRTSNRRGETRVVFGGPSLPAVIDRENPVSNGVTIRGVDASDGSGKALTSAGDFNGDGFGDIIIGTYSGRGRENKKGNTVEAYIVFGDKSLPSIIELKSLGSYGITIFGDIEASSVYASLSAGDVNGDGLDDVMIASEYSSLLTNQNVNLSRSHVIFGSKSSASSIDLQDLGSLGVTIFGGGGQTSSIGDLNADGNDDLIVCAAESNSAGNSRSQSGKCDVVFGQDSMPASIQLDVLGSSALEIWGGNTSDNFGDTVSGLGDFDGDGFNDVFIHARRANEGGHFGSAGRSYIIFGADFFNTVTHHGTSANNVLNGTSGADSIVGGLGKDRLVGNGGADVLTGGPGDDVISISDAVFQRVVGGPGFDVLQLSSNALDVDLTTIPDNRLTGIESIDLTNTGVNRLVLSLSEVLNISKQTNVLEIRCDRDDVIELGDGWTQGSDVTVDGDVFQIFEQGAATVKIGRALPVRSMTIDLASFNSKQGSIIYGANEGDQSGSVVSNAGDVNGDNFDDFLIAAWQAGGADRTPVGTGEVYVVFGSATLPTTIELETIGLAGGVSGFRILRAQPNEVIGTSVSNAGDVNGDGLDDLIVGNSLANDAATGRSKIGNSYLILGRRNFPKVVDLAANDFGGSIFAGEAANDGSGVSVSDAGDVNGDGFDDLIIGSPFAKKSDSAQHAAGASYLVFGRSVLPRNVDLGNLDTLGVKLVGGEQQEYFGISVRTAGDINADGYDDLLIGAGESYQVTAGIRSSVSYVVYGSSMLPKTIELSSLGTSGIKIIGRPVNLLYGTVIDSAGDINSDGFDDIIMGESQAVGNDETTRYGESYIVYGGASLPAAIELATLGLPNGTPGVTIAAPGIGNGSVMSVSGAGDVNGDGYEDALIGTLELKNATSGKEAVGTTYVIFGGQSLPSRMDTGELEQFGFSILSADPLDLSGNSVSAAGDVNGDGFEDTLIGASFAAGAGNLKTHVGESYLIFGRDFNSAVTHEGTFRSESIRGTLSADSMVGGLGNDTLAGFGGSDVLIGGNGDDVLGIGDTSFRRVVGGNGFDTLRLDGAGLTLDLTNTSASRIRSIEQIDLTGTGNNSLVLDAADTLNISMDANTLIVRGNEGDRVRFEGQWIRQPEESIGTQKFQVYQLGHAKLMIANEVETPNRPIILYSLTKSQGYRLDSTSGPVSDAGDVNGDGLDDVLFGERGNLALGRVVSRYPYETDSVRYGDVIPQPVSGEFGNATSLSSAGDFNGDGFDDYVIGHLAPQYLSRYEKTASYLILGRPSFPRELNLQFPTPNEIEIVGVSKDDFLGISVRSAGDINGDGLSDLITVVSKPNRLAEVYVIYGNSLPPQVIELAKMNSAEGVAGIKASGLEAGRFYGGISVSSAGDINGDGFADIIIGDNGFYKGTSGVAYVLYGGRNLPSEIDLSNLGDLGIVMRGGDLHDMSGASVSGGGDINGDGFDDMIIGASNADGLSNAKQDSGESYMVFGGRSLPSTLDFGNLGTFGVTILGPAASTKTGRSTRIIKDVNGDSYDDFLVNEGGSRAYLIFGRNAWPSTVDLAMLGGDGLVIGAPFFTTQIAFSGAGDVNGDGLSDIVFKGPGVFDSTLVYGHDFTLASITHLGTENSEAIIGTTSSDAIVGGRGNDVLIGSGGADAISGGQGNDILAVHDLAFKRLTGGNGIDTLRLDKAGLLLDLTKIPDNRLLGIEQIDLTGTGPNSLTLSALELLNLSDESNTLIVRGDTDDEVTLLGSWTSTPNATEMIDGVRYHVLKQGMATLKIGDFWRYNFGLRAREDDFAVPVNWIINAWDVGGTANNLPGDNGILANDYDLGGLPFKGVVIEPPTLGNIVLADNGTFQYRPLAQAIPGQIDTFRYRIHNATGEADSLTTVTIHIGDPIVSPRQNSLDRFDVDRNSSVEPLDVLRVINALQRFGSTEIHTLSDKPEGYYDVNGDFSISPLDILQVINRLKRRETSAEGERYDVLNETRAIEGVPILASGSWTCMLLSNTKQLPKNSSASNLHGIALQAGLVLHSQSLVTTKAGAERIPSTSRPVTGSSTDRLSKLPSDIDQFFATFGNEF